VRYTLKTAYRDGNTHRAGAAGHARQWQAQEGADEPATPHHVAMNWAQRLKRVFGIEIDRQSALL
jgi:hypothetical protein